MVDIDLWEAGARADLAAAPSICRVIRLLARYFRAHGGRAVLSPAIITEATGVTNPHYCTARLRKLGWIGGGGRSSEFVPLMPEPEGEK
jgi:hypothetical protein